MSSSLGLDVSGSKTFNVVSCAACWDVRGSVFCGEEETGQAEELAQEEACVETNDDCYVDDLSSKAAQCQYEALARESEKVRT